MKDVQELFLGVIDDLRQRRLLPVAIAMVVVAVAIPVLLLKPADEAPAPASAQPATASAASALASADSGKPLVTMAVLRDPSKLEVYRSRNPFKPMAGQAAESSDGGSSDSTDSGDSGSGSGDGLPTSSGSDSSGGGSGGGSSPTSTDQTTQSNPSTPSTPETTPTTPESKPDTEEQEKLTYAIDLTLEGPKGVRRYRNVPRLQTLPSASQPLFVFLGVQDGGSKVTFLVDAKLRSVGGEASCAPAPDQCATLSIEPGQRHTFTNDAGEIWTVQIDQVREVSVAAASAAARKRNRRDARVARASAAPAERFELPVLTDLFTGGQR